MRTSLHESTSVCPPLLISSHLISSQPHAQTLPPTYSALSLCSLHFPNTHTHTSTRPLSCTTHPRTLYIFFALSTPAAQDHFSLSSWTLTLSKSLHSAQ